KDLNDIQRIVNEGNKLNDGMSEVEEGVKDNNEGRKERGNYLNADSQVKDDFDEGMTQGEEGLDDGSGCNLRIDETNEVKDAMRDRKDGLNGKQRLNDWKCDGLKKLDES
ncbi:hypothetical protein, partial [Staphylococcus warneri]|uniref:hypothetical protein n=1 Tax=Staphylococcus warneri TaxID=1292 RepID=UPI00164254D0